MRAWRSHPLPMIVNVCAKINRKLRNRGNFRRPRAGGRHRLGTVESVKTMSRRAIGNAARRMAGRRPTPRTGPGLGGTRASAGRSRRADGAGWAAAPRRLPAVREPPEPVPGRCLAAKRLASASRNRRAGAVRPAPGLRLWVVGGMGAHGATNGRTPPASVRGHAAFRSCGSPAGRGAGAIRRSARGPRRKRPGARQGGRRPRCPSRCTVPTPRRCPPREALSRAGGWGRPGRRGRCARRTRGASSSSRRRGRTSRR